MDKKKLAVGKGVSVGRSVEEIIVTRALNDVPDTPILPHIKATSQLASRGCTKQQQLMSRSTSGLPGAMNRTRLDTGQRAPRVEDWVGAGEEDGQGGVVESLAQYCKILQQKIDELQHKVSHSDAVVEVLKADIRRLGGSTRQYPDGAVGARVNSGLGAHRDSFTSQLSAGVRRMSTAHVSFGVDPMQTQHQKHAQSQIRGVVGDMDSKVVQLRQLFTNVDPLDERARAATSIAAGIRGFLARRRYAVFTDSVMSWKWGRSRVFVAVLQHMTARVSRIDKGMMRMKMKRDTLLIRTVMSKWYQVVQNVLPLRRSIAQQAEEKRLIKIFKLKLQIFLAFREGCIGSGSIKQARRARRALIEQKRSEIVEENFRATGQRLLASEDQVMKAVHKQVLTNAKEHMRRQKLKHTFDRIGSLYHDMKLKNRQSNRYMFKKFAGRVFYAWSNWIFLVSVGLDRRRWVAPGKYEIKYNQKQVDNFSRLRCERFCFVAWKRYGRVSKAVTLKFVRKQTGMVRSFLLAWRTVVKKFKRLLKESMNNWLGYPNLLMAGPFDAWKDLSSTARQHREAQERVMKAYRRWKTRQKMANILKTWRHQAVYGSVEGMYSRTNLTKSLAEQKNMANAMQKLVSQQTLELEKCRNMIKQEVGARGMLEKTLVIKDQEIIRMKISENHTSQEIHRLHALIDAMSKINPRQMKLIKRLQDEFGFTARPITGHGPQLPDVDARAILAEAEQEELGSNSGRPDLRIDTGAVQELSDNTLDSETSTRLPPAVSSRPTTVGTRPITAATEDSDAAPVNVVNVLNISPEDESLLRRAKWLLGRFLMEKSQNTHPLSQLLGHQFTSMQSSFEKSENGSDSEETETTEMEQLRLQREHDDRDGLADTGIFGGRKRHSLVIQSSGEINISNNPSSPSKNAASVDLHALQSANIPPMSLVCPHCSDIFEPDSEQLNPLRKHLLNILRENGTGLNSQADSLAGLRAISPSEIHDDEQNVQDNTQNDTEYNRTGAKKYPKKGIKKKLKPIPLVPSALGTIPMPLMEPEFLQQTSRLMLAMSVFLTEGCTDYFNLDDRRHWAATLARCVSDNSRTLEPVVEGWGGDDPDAADEIDGVVVDEEVKLPEIPAATGAWALAEGGSDGTWREALLELRTAYPAGLQSYGMCSEEAGLYQRVAEMRSHLRKVSTEIEKRAADNFTTKHPSIVTLPSPRATRSLAATNGSMFDPLSTVASGSQRADVDMRETGVEIVDGSIAAEELLSPLNIYSQTLPLQVKDIAPSGGGRRLMGPLPDTSHLKGKEDDKKNVAASGTGAKTPPITPHGGSRGKKKGFFSHIEGQPNEFNVDDMSLSQAGSADDLPTM